MEVGGRGRNVRDGTPMDPPADIDENSNTPSKGGLSSPTRKRVPWKVSLRAFSCVTLERKSTYSSVWKRVMTSAVARLGRYDGSPDDARGDDWSDLQGRASLAACRMLRRVRG